jgi:hypothetical protein
MTRVGQLNPSSPEGVVLRVEKELEQLEKELQKYETAN